VAKEQEELAIIRKVLTESKSALSISDIQKQTRLDIEPRTLLRRLDKLEDQGVIVKIGKTRGTAYQLVLNAELVEQHPELELIPLTAKSKDLLTLMDQSTTNRTPVGYNREFLELYEPNITSYLTDTEKKTLAESGKTERQNEPAGTYAKDILQRLLIDLSWNSSRLEGNTYSLLDTQRLILIGEAADNKSVKDAQMILNHKEAIEFIVENSEDIAFNRYTILNIHGLLSNNLLPDPAASGRLRKFGVGIQKSVFIPLGIPQVIEEMFDLMLAKATEIEDPFEQAFFIMVHLPYLQPFEDVNKRVSRLAANISLNKRNLVPVSFIDVPDSLYIKGMLAVYELNNFELLKDVFLWAYERSSARYSALRQSLGEPDPFRLKYRDAIRSLISEIVSNAYPFEETMDLIKNKAAEILESDQSKFTEAVETELLSLHEGNMARYKIRPSEFVRWRNVWSKK
jgi:Fic family protein